MSPNSAKHPLGFGCESLGIPHGRTRWTRGEPAAKFHCARVEHHAHPTLLAANQGLRKVDPRREGNHGQPQQHAFLDDHEEHEEHRYDKHK